MTSRHILDIFDIDTRFIHSAFRDCVSGDEEKRCGRNSLRQRLWCKSESDIASGRIHREYNLMLKLSNDKYKRKKLI